MADKAWKRFERTIAKILGTERTPLSGGNSKHTRSDSLHGRLFVECKLRKSQAIHRLFRDTKELAKKEKKIPIVITREPGMKTTLVTVEMKDIDKIYDYFKGD